jgi:hypothetical protein
VRDVVGEAAQLALADPIRRCADRMGGHSAAERITGVIAGFIEQCSPTDSGRHQPTG